jgi:hypothetical protein
MTLCKCAQFYLYDEYHYLCKCYLCRLRLATKNYYLFDRLTLYLIYNPKKFNFYTKLIFIIYTFIIFFDVLRIFNIIDIFFYNINTSIFFLFIFSLLNIFSFYFIDFYLKKYRINL